MSTKSTHFNTTAKTSAVTGTSPWKLLGTLIAPYKGLAVLADPSLRYRGNALYPD